jgi:hypothetical protein
MIRGQYNADPGLALLRGRQAADRRDIEFLPGDTAGRLHTKATMAELRHHAASPNTTRMRHTSGFSSLTPPPEVTRSPKRASSTPRSIYHSSHKLDGSGKAGIVIAIQHELGIPTGSSAQAKG